MREASSCTRTSCNAQEAFQAGAELLSKQSQVDYYGLLSALNLLSPREVIASLPLSDAHKQELQPRAAPVKLK